jgi:PAS domain S-box-containing protein
MTWQYNPFGLVFALATLVNSAILIYSLRHREVRGAFSFALMMTAMVAWALFLALEYSVVEIENKILFSKFQYFGITTIGLTWFLFAYAYSTGRKLPNKNYLLLLVVPVAILILAFTNESHLLLWPEVRPVSSIPGADLIYEHGPAFWVNAIYNYVLLAFGTFLIVRTALGSKEIYRWQMVGLVSSAVIPWLGNLISLSGLSPVPGLDLAPISFVLTGVIIAWSIFFLRLLDMLPVAQDQVIANLTEGVVVLDPNNRIADLNPKARQMLGMGSENVIGRNIVDFMQSWPNLVEQLGGLEYGQLEIQLGEGILSDIDVQITPLLDNRKNPMGRIVIVRDISRQKKIERMRSDLTQSIVNDLRNPLTSMSLGLEMLRRQANTTLPKPQIEVIDNSQTNIQQMLELVDSILDIYRLQSGEVPLERQKVSLHTLAGDAFKTISSLANRKRILLQLDIPEGMPPVDVDASLMRRVLQNLLGISIKSSQEGRVVRIQARYEKNDEVVVSVIDAGAGMEASVTRNLLENPVSAQGNSGGLGLAFCRLAVEAHGGRIWVDEHYDNGTKISFSIP